MNNTNILHRVSKLEAIADLIKQEANSLRNELNKKPAPAKQAKHKLAADIVAKRNARLIK